MPIHVLPAREAGKGILRHFQPSEWEASPISKEETRMGWEGTISRAWHNHSLMYSISQIVSSHTVSNKQDNKWIVLLSRLKCYQPSPPPHWHNNVYTSYAWHMRHFLIWPPYSATLKSLSFYFLTKKKKNHFVSLHLFKKPLIVAEDSIWDRLGTCDGVASDMLFSDFKMPVLLLWLS